MFQDAVIATRELGIRYLWINSLCIIQDSVEDWELECSKMAQIYQGSIVTLCAPASPDSSSGFLGRRTCPDPAPYLWEYMNPGETRPKRATLTFLPRNFQDYPVEPRLTTKEKTSAVQHRGWILQEYILPRRLLFFGLSRMYWECNTCIQFEDFPLTRASPYTRLHDELLKAEITQSLIAPEPGTLWRTGYYIVQEYSRRALTKPSDKLPAISGVAAWLLGTTSKEDYLAGLLKHAIHEGLAWHVVHSQERQIIIPPTPMAHDRAPSWSWASTDEPVEFVAYLPRVRLRSETDPEARRRRFLSLSQQNRIRVCDTYVKNLGCNPLGEIAAGSIVLEGKVTTLTNGSREGTSTIWFQGPVSRKNIAVLQPDDARRWRSNLPEKITCLCIDYWENTGGWLALVIEPVSPRDGSPRSARPSAIPDRACKAYRRIGLFQLHSSMGESDIDWFKNSSWERLELF